MTTWDAIVVGAGQAGVPLAVALARAGKRVAVIERDAVGGTCINVGCTPTKTLVASGRIAALAARARAWGVETGPVRADWPAVREREQGVVARFRTGGEKRLADAGVTLVRGEARFVGARRFLVRRGDTSPTEHAAPVVVLDVGGRPVRPALPGLDDVPALDSSSILRVERFPERLVVLGAGYVALELGQVFRRLGAEVTLVEPSSRILPREEPSVSAALHEALAAEGVGFRFGTRGTRVEREGSGIALTLGTGERLVGSHLLVATGRTPNTDTLDCAAGGVAVDAHGSIQVDARLRTTAEGVWAAGDATGAPAFTHVAYDDYRVIAPQLLGGPERTTTGRLVPYTLFTDPQLGRVGLTEAEARAQGLPVRVAELPMAHVARAIEAGETRGLLRAVVHAETERILGFSALGLEGGELASVVQLAMLGDVRWPILRDAVFPHPGLAEALNNLFSAVV